MHRTRWCNLLWGLVLWIQMCSGQAQEGTRRWVCNLGWTEPTVETGDLEKDFSFSITEGTAVQEGWRKNRSGSCAHYLLHPWSRKHMRASSGLDHLWKAERANSGRSERIELGDGELTEHWISCSSKQSSFFESCNKSQEIGISDVMQWFDFVT